MSKTCFCGISEHCGYQIETDMVQHDKVIYEQGYNKAIDEFAKSLKTDYVNFDLYYILQNNNFAFENTSLKSYQDMIDELAEQLKGEKQ